MSYETSCFYNSTSFDKFKFNFDCFKFKFINDLKFTTEAFAFVILIVLIVFVNMIVIISTLLNKARKPIDLCFLSNSFSDLIMGTVVIPITGVYTLFGHFPFSVTTCYVWTCIDFTIGTISMLHITYISYDRYIAVSNPIKYKYSLRSKSRDSNMVKRSLFKRAPTYLVLFMIWIFAALLWVPVILYLKNKHTSASFNTNYLEIKNSSSNEQLFWQCDIFMAVPWIVVPHSLIVYNVPMVLIIFFYSKTLGILNDKIKSRPRLFTKKLSIKIEDKKGFYETFQQKCQQYFPRYSKKTIDYAQTTAVNRANNCQLSTSDCSSYLYGKKTIETNASNDNKSRRNQFKELVAFRSKNPDFLISKTISISLKSFQATPSNKDDLNKECQRLKSDSIFGFNVEKIKSNSFLDLSKNNNNTIARRNSNIISLVEAAKSENQINKKTTNRSYNEVERSTYLSIQAIVNKRDSQEKRVTYRVGMIMITFILSWAPFSLFWPLGSVCSECVPTGLYLFSFWLAYANSFITPLLVLVSNSKYKESMNLFFRRRNSQFRNFRRIRRIEIKSKI